VMTPVVKEKRKKQAANKSRNKRDQSVPEETQPAAVADLPDAVDTRAEEQ
jgi:hypothetical protein